ncbi:MAG: PEP-CTERM sorting domain-containing protein [Planctomycetota bacterium]
MSNPNDYDHTPVDAWQRLLYKVLVPDTIPEPPTMIILALGAVLLRKRK